MEKLAEKWKIVKKLTLPSWISKPLKYLSNVSSVSEIRSLDYQSLVPRLKFFRWFDGQLLTSFLQDRLNESLELLRAWYSKVVNIFFIHMKLKIILTNATFFEVLNSSNCFLFSLFEIEDKEKKDMWSFLALCLCLSEVVLKTKTLIFLVEENNLK